MALHVGNVYFTTQKCLTTGLTKMVGRYCICPTGMVGFERWFTLPQDPMIGLDQDEIDSIDALNTAFAAEVVSFLDGTNAWPAFLSNVTDDIETRHGIT